MTDHVVEAEAAVAAPPKPPIDRFLSALKEGVDAWGEEVDWTVLETQLRANQAPTHDAILQTLTTAKPPTNVLEVQ